LISFEGEIQLMEDHSKQEGGSRQLSRQQRRALARQTKKQGAEKVLVSGAALALGVGLGFGQAADAATFTVTNLNDSGAGSLRDAISQANGAAGADTVTFQAGLTGTITLTSGQLYISDSVDIQGPGAPVLTVSGNNASRVFYLYSSSALIDVSISGLTITGGNASIGGGIVDFDENLTLDHVAITGNHASGDGGGLWMDGFSFAATIRDSTISGNTADGEGGGVYNEDTGGSLLFQRTVISNNQAGGSGGGIYLYDPDHDVTIEDSTISGNTAGGAGGGIYLYDTDGGPFTIRGTTISGNSAQAGGGIFFYGPDDPVVIQNSTISGNQATAGNGGGIYLYSFYGSFVIEHSTIAANTAASGSGGGLFTQSGPVTIDHTIVADNTAKSDDDLATAVDGSIDLTFSLVESPGAANVTDNGGNVLNQDPQLGPLQNNGGPTQTQKPAVTSPAVNAGDPAFTPPPSTDQRGLPRVAGGRIDIGAVEINAGTIQLTVSTVSVAEGAGTVTITATRTGGADGPVSVSYATANGTATAPADYASAAGTLNWADQDSAPKSFQVTIVNDTLDEPDETFNVILSAPTGGATLGAITTETVTILDDDAPAAAPIPTLGDFGEGLLAGLLGLGGLLALRRRKLAAPVVALTLTLGGVHAADARVKPAKDLRAGALQQVDLKGTVAILHLADGTTLTVPLGEVEIKDRRKHDHPARTAPTLGGLPAGQPVVIKVKHGADGSIRQVKLQLFDTTQAAQAAAQRKSH
jgi:MYXO-CTERM domain-containing protein